MFCMCTYTFHRICTLYIKMSKELIYCILHFKMSRLFPHLYTVESFQCIRGIMFFVIYMLNMLFIWSPISLFQLINSREFEGNPTGAKNSYLITDLIMVSLYRRLMWEGNFVSKLSADLIILKHVWRKLTKHVRNASECNNKRPQEAIFCTAIIKACITLSNQTGKKTI